jgi:8-oxo-dGTP pyrophosphatase MutT (NUDIX family)
MEKEHSAGIIIYRKTKEGPKFLLLYHGGRYWSFPKGKLAENERSFKAAIREVKEETGIKAQDLKFRDWFRVKDQFTFTKDKKTIHKEVVYYLAETKTSVVRLKNPPPGSKGERHEGYGWFLEKDAMRILMHKNHRRNIKKAYELILHKKRSPGRPKHSPR